MRSYRIRKIPAKFLVLFFQHLLLKIVEEPLFIHPYLQFDGAIALIIRPEVFIAEDVLRAVRF